MPCGPALDVGDLPPLAGLRPRGPAPARTAASRPWPRRRDPRTSIDTVSPSATSGASSAKAIPCLRVGEKVPEVTSPTVSPSRVDGAVRPRDATTGHEQTAHEAGRRGLLGLEGGLAPEGVLLPADRPAGPRLHRRDVERQVLPVERVAHLGAQRVTRTQATRHTAEGLERGHEGVPQRGRVVPPRHELVAALTGVAGAADDDRAALPVGLDEGHVVVARRQAERSRAPRRSSCPARR